MCNQVIFGQKFPNTPEGIKSAIASVGDNDYWETYVNWGDSRPTNQQEADSMARQRVKDAIGCGADISPAAYGIVAAMGIRIETVKEENRNDYTALGRIVCYSGTESRLDLPASVSVAGGFRANLPA